MKYETIHNQLEDIYIVKEAGIAALNAKVIVTVRGDRELANDLEHYLETYSEHKEFYENLQDVPAPTEIEKVAMQEKLYDERLHQLKVFIDKIPVAKWLIASACHQVLVSISGSRERAIQEWMHDTTYPGVDEGKVI